MWSKIEEWLAGTGFIPPPFAAEKFKQYYETLMIENKKVNLTRITDENEVYIKHFLDSLELLAWRANITGAVLDVGSGAGLPGIPLKIVFPQLSLTLIDSSRKRVAFLEKIATHLELDMVTPLHGRAEDYAQNPVYREQFPLVISRAVARMNILCELCLPFVSPGGYFVAYKGPEGQSELDEATPVITELGGAMDDVWPYTLPDRLGQRTLFIIKKIAATPKKYPRKAGLPAKKPLGI